MPSAPSLIQEILRRLVLRLILMVGCARILGLRARLAGMREGHRHRAGLERELAKAERYAALLAEAAFWEHPGTEGKAAEVARVMADAGRRALVRRVIWPGRRRRLLGLDVAGSRQAWFGRCTGGGGDCAFPLPSPQPLPQVREGGSMDRALFCRAPSFRAD